MRSFQTTLANSVSCQGVGLHSGKVVKLTLHPAPADTGVVFRRIDIEATLRCGREDSAKTDWAAQEACVVARYDLVEETKLGTVLRNAKGVEVSTVEHLMAAVAGCGLDNAIVDLDGPEIPIMDGSAEPFVFLIECAGVTQLAAPLRSVRILETVSVTLGESTLTISPAPAFSLDVDIEFNDDAIGRQRCMFHLEDNSFKRELSRARTFGFLKDFETLNSMGLARGGSLDNCIVINESGVMNEGGLRHRDEFVRHKALDLLGDLRLAGSPLIGAVNAVKPGHAINNLLLRRLFDTPAAWTIDEDASRFFVAATRKSAALTA